MANNRVEKEIAQNKRVKGKLIQTWYKVTSQLELIGQLRKS